MAVREISMRDVDAEHARPAAGDEGRSDTPQWVANAALLWANRRLLAGVCATVLVLSAAMSLVLPKEYESTTRIMPPEQATGGAAMLAALAGRGSLPGGGLAGLAGGLLGGRTNGALFVALLHSGTVSGRLMERFQLQQVYHKRYLTDTAKKLAGETTITEDAKSGVIAITVEDRERWRARDMAQAYVDELNALMAQVDTSAAHRERVFIEQRLKDVDRDLQQAQTEMSEFATKNTAIDITAQTRAMVDAGAKLQGELVASESELDSLRQIYGAGNVRVKAAEARVGTLEREQERESNGAGAVGGDNNMPYPALRELPALAVPWANLYRRVKIEETVYEMLSSQFETARIEEAKSLPTVSVVDPAGWPEKKSSPHRTIIVLASTAAAFVLISLFLLMRRWWHALDEGDGRKMLGREIALSLSGPRVHSSGGAR